MVMEATPSPQSVGREFVRQYYTLLHQMPAHLHRFYNQHSSFVHGGLDSNKESAPAIGQKQIHQKIQQLNFQDCHAKISQVDSQLTLENGVVVQVSGELSNAGQPMRRFTQTFVLAIQAPKKYYVHNDIFRYQDIIFPDEEEGGVGSVEGGMNETGEREVEEGSRSEPEEDEHNQAQQHSVAPPVNEPQPPLITAQPPMPMYYAAPPQPHVHAVMQQVINGTAHEETPIITQPQVAPQPQPPQTQHQYIAETANQTQFIQEPELETTAEQQVKEETQSPSEEVHEEQPTENFVPSAPEQESEHQVANTNVNNSEPKTYATLVKSYSSTTGSSSPSAPKISMSPPPMSSLRLDDRSTLNQTGPALSTTSGVSSTAQPQPQRAPNQQPPMSTPYQQRPPRTGGPVQRDGERRGPRPGQYSDAHQLFLGNLPHSATESDLREVFERYGKVAELRVHSKTNERSKGPQGGNNSTRLPNYGFITFEDSQVVNKVLNSLPIYYLDKNGQNQKLNVEEKKIRSRGSMDGSGGRINSGDNMRTMGGPQQSQQRGPGGPGGMMRGGQHNARGGRGGFSRGGDGGRGGGMRQSNNPNNASYQNRRS